MHERIGRIDWRRQRAVRRAWGSPVPDRPTMVPGRRRDPRLPLQRRRDVALDLAGLLRFRVRTGSVSGHPLPRPDEDSAGQASGGTAVRNVEDCGMGRASTARDRKSRLASPPRGGRSPRTKKSAVVFKLSELEALLLLRCPLLEPAWYCSEPGRREHRTGDSRTTARRRGRARIAPEAPGVDDRVVRTRRERGTE